MEAMVKKYQQIFRKVIQDPKNSGRLTFVNGISEAILGNQMESLEYMILSMEKTMEKFHGIVLSLEKILLDTRQLVKGGSMQPTIKQMQLRVGMKPNVEDCLERLRVLHEMHHSEYLLKSSVVSALPALILKPSVSDLGALHQLLVDQPNIPKEEVQFAFDIIFAEEIC